MRIEHVAVWAADIELLRAFYIKYFGFKCGNKYSNPAKGFMSYFLYSGEADVRLELMQGVGKEAAENRANLMGLAHLAIAVGSEDSVDALTEQLRTDGYAILSEPRVTGDGYYESVVADPEGNCIEITV